MMGMAPTGKGVTASGIEVFRFQNGKMAEHWAAFDALGMLRQIGVIDRAPVEQLAENPQGAPQPAYRHPGVVNGILPAPKSHVTLEDLLNLGIHVSGQRLFGLPGMRATAFGRFHCADAGQLRPAPIRLSASANSRSGLRFIDFCPATLLTRVSRRRPRNWFPQRQTSNRQMTLGLAGQQSAQRLDLAGRWQPRLQVARLRASAVMV
jgi:hypothetical protein